MLKVYLAVLLFCFGAGSTNLYAQVSDTVSVGHLKRLSLEELMDVEVTLVSRTPQKLSESASAIQVITGHDIRRSGALNLPDALRLTANLQVAQYNSSAWIVSSRGFNTIFANKLLVMIDGRSIYTPLFGGVLWELQHILLEDVDRIEIVSGPGGTLWGANAVNGIVNIITKKTSETVGSYVSVAYGENGRRNIGARHGGRLGKEASYRVYGLHNEGGHTFLKNGNRNTDDWSVTQGGFRVDFKKGNANDFVIQGDLYSGNKKTKPQGSPINGQNLLARWSHTISSESDMELQVFFDRYYRDDQPGQSSDELVTIDADFQHRFGLGRRHKLLWGSGYRVVNDNVQFYTNNVAILPQRKRLDLFTAFLQDEIAIRKNIHLTLGSKLIHNVYSGFELQPSARLGVELPKSQFLWAAVTRAVRTPSRFDVDYFLPAFPVPPPAPSVAGGPNFISEKALVYEAGYRVQPSRNLSFSLSLFYHDYRDVYSVEALPGTQTYQIQNGSEAKTWGAELSATYHIGSAWRIRGGYTYFDKNIKAKPGRNFDPSYLTNDVKNQVFVQSNLNLPYNIHFDLTGRYLDNLPATIATPAIESYYSIDARLAWTYKLVELAVIAQNLNKKQHAEFGPFVVPRTVFGRVTFRF